MSSVLCATCGTQYPDNADPERCPICEDSRQYVGWNGQQWMTLAGLRTDHRNEIREEEQGLHSIHTTPEFAINQRAFVVQTPEGNLLWDCVALIDEQTIDHVQSLGGIGAIAISHPHYYTTMIEWSRAFGSAPIYLHEADRKWVMRPDPAVQFWSGEAHDLHAGLKLVHTGGHFDGYQVLHWPRGNGVLLAGDQPQVAMDRRWLGFLYSYPNYIPLGPEAVRTIANRLRELTFDRLYGAFPGKVVSHDAHAAVQRSAERHLRMIAS